MPFSSVSKSTLFETVCLTRLYRWLAGQSARSAKELTGKAKKRLVLAKLCLGGIDMFTYCLFCETSKCTYIAAIAEALFSCKAIRPKQVQHIVSKDNQVKDITRDFLPGYIFLFFEEDPFPAILQARYIPGVLRMLGDAASKYALSGPDEEFSEMLLERNGVFGKTRVYEENGMLCLYPSDFRHSKAKILKVSRKKQRMKIQLRIADQKPTTWVEYEIIESR